MADIQLISPPSALFDDAVALLRECGLPTEDIQRPEVALFAATQQGQLRGVIGLECHGEDALLRSLAVRSPDRKSGLGAALTGFIIDHARSEGCAQLFLLTYNAAAFFEKLGFRRHERKHFPARLSQTPQLASLCSDRAVALRLDLTQKLLRREDRASITGVRDADAAAR